MAKCASRLSTVGGLGSTETPELDWEQLIEAHRAPLRAIIRRRVKASSVEDVLQETFERAFRNRESIDREREILPWLVTIAKRAAADSRRRQRPTVDVAVIEQLYEESGFEHVEERLVSPLKRQGIGFAFTGLNSMQKRVLASFANGISFDEVAIAENMTPNAVRCVASRAKTNFRQSYFGFGRGKELFGGAVGAALLKLRLRLQRYQDFVNGHGTAISVATVTVVAVGIAAVPAARPTATYAQEGNGLSTTAIVTDAMNLTPSANEGSGIAQVHGLRDTSHAGIAQSKPSDTVTATAGVATQAQLDNDGTTLRADATTGVHTSEVGVRNVFTYEVDCTKGILNPIECQATDTLPQP